MRTETIIEMIAIHDEEHIEGFPSKSANFNFSKCNQRLKGSWNYSSYPGPNTIYVNNYYQNALENTLMN